MCPKPHLTGLHGIELISGMSGLISCVCAYFKNPVMRSGNVNEDVARAYAVEDSRSGQFGCVHDSGRASD
jgi:hypothetical protein